LIIVPLATPPEETISFHHVLNSARPVHVKAGTKAGAAPIGAGAGLTPKSAAMALDRDNSLPISMCRATNMAAVVTDPPVSRSQNVALVNTHQT
jgi:hypothetical protein